MSTIFLNRSDVLNFSAQRLEQMANDVRIALIISQVIKPEDKTRYQESARLSEAFADLMQLRSCPVDQEKLLMSVAKLLRDLAIEEAILKSKENV